MGSLVPFRFHSDECRYTPIPLCFSSSEWSGQADLVTRKTRLKSNHQAGKKTQKKHGEVVSISQRRLYTAKCADTFNNNVTGIMVRGKFCGGFVAEYETREITASLVISNEYTA